MNSCITFISGAVVGGIVAALVISISKANKLDRDYESSQYDSSNEPECGNDEYEC
jgi:hypothetical protein